MGYRICYEISETLDVNTPHGLPQVMNLGYRLYGGDEGLFACNLR